ncbi:hypothetical protein Tco_1493871 [Tanacetum coccineum]
MLWLSLHATLHSHSLQMFQKSTCINLWDSVKSMTLSIQFKMGQKERFKLNLKSFRDTSRSSLEFVSAKEETQIYGAILPESLTSPEIKESKAYKTYLVSTEEPTRKSKRVKRPAKKSTKAPTRGVVIRETPEMPLSKKKEKTHPSGSEESSESGAESWGNDEDDSNNEQDSSGEESDQKNDSDDNKTQSDNENESDSEHETDENESGLESDQEENEEELNEPVDTDKEFVQEEGTDAAMTNVQQRNENLEIVQVIEDAHVTLSTVPQKTEVLVTSSSHSSDLAAKFLNFSDISHMDAEIVSLMDVHVHHEVPSKQTPTLLTVPVSVITDSSLSLEDAVIAKESSQPESLYEAAATLTEFELKKILIDKMDKSESYLAAPKHRECYEGLKKSYDLDKTIFSTMKRKTGKDATLVTGTKANESQSGSSKGEKSQSKSSGKSVQSEELKFEVADSDMPQDQEENLGNDHEKPKEKTPQQGQNQRWLMTLASSAKKPSKTFYELMSTPIDFSAFIMNGLKINNLSQETLLGPAFRLLKGTRSNYAELEYDFEECYKALSEKLDWRIQKGFYTLSYNRPWDWLWAFHMTFNEDAQFEEVRRKTMRDFHKTHPTGSRDVKIIPSVKSEGTCVKPGVPNVTKEESSESEVESWGNNEDDSNNEQDSSGEDIDQ